MSALFPSISDEILFWVVFLGGWLAVAFVARKAGGYKEPDKKKGIERRLVSALFGAFVLVITVVIGYLRIGVLPSYLFYPGLVIWVAGFAIFCWAIFTLGRFYSQTIRIVSGHKVIQTGPYRFVRHPVYAGQILAYVGLALALQSWVALIIILIGAGIVFGSRVRAEERFMVTELGDDYIQYMKHVKRFIPYVL